jgi:hypothetical protein
MIIMKKILPLFILGLFVFVSCKDNDRTVTGEPENATDAARTFIRAALDGDYQKARTYLVDDSINQEDISISERLYNERMSAEDKAQYKGASIHIHETKKLDDSTSIVYYSNSYRNQRDSLKVIRENEKWLIDFKYIFKHKPDTLQ